MELGNRSRVTLIYVLIALGLMWALQSNLTTQQRKIPYSEFKQRLAQRTHKISIVPRGMAALGLTWQRPTEDRYLLTTAELRDRIAALLGGRAAEEVFIGDVTTGAQNDLARATDIARAMVRQYGMSEILGPVAFDPEQKSVLPVRDFMPSCEHGSAVGDQIDAEVRRVLEEGLTRAREVLESPREQVEQVAARLLEQEQLEGDDLRSMLAAES